MENTNLDFGEFVLKFDQSQRREKEIPEIQRALISITLQKRYRGETFGDRMGRWNFHGSQISASSVTYAEPEILGLIPLNIFTKNIVKRIVRANASIMSQAKISVICKPRQEQNSKAKKNALICQKISDWTDDELWTDDLNLDINIAKQLTHGVFLRSFYNPQKEGKAYQSEDWDEEMFEQMPQVACTECGASEYLGSPMPEAAETIEAQIQATLDPQNPKVAVLFTDNAQLEQLPEEVMDSLIPVPVEEGLLAVNGQKTGFQSPEEVEAYVAENGYAELLGKVEDLTGQTTEGAVVQTSQNGNELMSSVVQNPQNLQQQAQIDSAQFPDAEQKIMPVQDALYARADILNPPNCQLCGGQTEIILPGEQHSLASKKVKEEITDGDNDIEIVPAMEMVVDENNSQGARLNKCSWVMRRKRMSRFEIEQQFGDVELGDPSDWAFSTQWLYTLQTGFSFRTSKPTEVIKSLDKFEVRFYYFTPEFLACAKSDKEYSFTNKKDNFTFKVKANQNPRDMILSLAKKEADGKPCQKKGLCVAVINDKILGFNLIDFRKELDYTYFVSDPYSFWGLCYSELETQQHLVNQMLTAIMNQVQENKNKLAVDGEAFDDEDLDGDSDIIHRRQDYDKPMKDSFEVIPGVPVTPDTWTALQYAEKSADDVALVSEEMFGRPSGVDTLGQAELNRDMSVGTLTPAQQSTASAKVGVCKKHCFIAQEYWQPQRLAELCLSQDSTITDEDIENFFKSDIENDVVFSYLEGSEIPKTQIQRQRDVLEYTNFLVEMAKAIPDIITPALAFDLLSRMADYKNLEGLDVQNAELDREVAESRYEIIVQGIEQETQKQLQVEQTEAQMLNAVLNAVMQNPILMPLPQENHTVATEYYRDKAMTQYKRERPDLMIIGACSEMIRRHSQARVKFGQQQTTEMLEIQAPAMQMQQEQQAAAQNQALQQQSAQDAQAQEQVAAQQQVDEAKSDEDKEFQVGMKMVELDDKEKDRKHQKEMAKSAKPKK